MTTKCNIVSCMGSWSRKRCGNNNILIILKWDKKHLQHLVAWFSNFHPLGALTLHTKILKAYPFHTLSVFHRALCPRSHGNHPLSRLQTAFPLETSKFCLVQITVHATLYYTAPPRRSIQHIQTQTLILPQTFL